MAARPPTSREKTSLMFFGVAAEVVDEDAVHDDASEREVSANAPAPIVAERAHATMPRGGGAVFPPI